MDLEKAIQGEIDTAFLYQQMMNLLGDPELQKFYGQMAEIEKKHIQKFYEKIRITNPDYRLKGPSGRAKTIAWLGKIFGSGIILGVLFDTEKSMTYATIANKTKNKQPITGKEGRHVSILKSLQSLSGSNIGKIEGRHRTVGGNALRAAVLGANDGLVSNLSLVMGVAGASAASAPILIAGMAGLIAGAISMALGEWISVKSSLELYQRQIALEFEELENNPEEEKQELLLLYKAKGFSDLEAGIAVDKIWADPEQTKKVLITEELGINQDELKGSAWEAAIASFFLFIAGAVIPVVPFFFLKGSNALIMSISFSTLGLFLIGSAITLITGKSILTSGFRQVLFGLAAGGITFGIGKIIGVALV